MAADAARLRGAVRAGRPRAERSTRAVVGWLFGVGHFIVGHNWIATAFTYQAEMPAWLGWIAVVLLSLYLAVYPALAAGLAWRFGSDRPLALVLALAGGWASPNGCGRRYSRFAWNPVGARWSTTPLLGSAPLVGTYGLSRAGRAARRRDCGWRLGANGGAPAGIRAVAALLLLACSSGLALARATPLPLQPPIRWSSPTSARRTSGAPAFADDAASALAALSGAPGARGRGCCCGRKPR